MTERIADELTGISTGIAGLLFAEQTLASALDRAMSLAEEAIPGTAGAGVTLIGDAGATSVAYSDEVVNQADGLQYELDEGPCLSAARDKRTYRIDSMAHDERWPRWAPKAAGIGILSSLSEPLMLRDASLGAIKVYSEHVAAYDARNERMLSIFANHCAMTIANIQRYLNAQELTEGLRDALKGGQAISEAMGILMEREGIDDETALRSLRRATEDHSVKLKEVAREVIQSVGAKAIEG